MLINTALLVRDDSGFLTLRRSEYKVFINLVLGELVLVGG